MVLSGQPLITDDQFEKLLANAPKSPEEMECHDPAPVVKFFVPQARWLLCWIYPDDRDRVFVVAKFGNDTPEAGDAMLSEIVDLRLGGRSHRYMSLRRRQPTLRRARRLSRQPTVDRGRALDLTDIGIRTSLA
jgi:Protein of unknown function (DUF2958)